LAPSSKPIGARHRDRPRAWICGGRGNITTTAATSKSSPSPTAGRSGPPTCAPDESTTPPLYLRRLGDLGYESEADTITVAFKKPKNGALTDTQQTFNKAHNGIWAIGERGNALLKMTFRALRNISMNPWRIGDIVAAALAILHTDHRRTT